VVAVFLVFYFTPILETVLGLGGPAATIDSGAKLLVSVFLAFGQAFFSIMPPDSDSKTGLNQFLTIAVSRKTLFFQVFPRSAILIFSN
jgi:hypothetical protein